jgi:hypothetical protein
MESAMTLRTLTGLFALTSLFAVGCAVDTGDENVLSSPEALRAPAANVIDSDCPPGQHQECSATQTVGRNNLVAPPTCTCVDDEPPPPPDSPCPPGQHIETQCSARQVAHTNSLVAPPVEPPTCTDVCVDDEPPPSGDCPPGFVAVNECSASAQKKGTVSVISCVVVCEPQQ